MNPSYATSQIPSPYNYSLSPSPFTLSGKFILPLQHSCISSLKGLDVVTKIATIFSISILTYFPFTRFIPQYPPLHFILVLFQTGCFIPLSVIQIGNNCSFQIYTSTLSVYYKVYVHMYCISQKNWI